MEHERDIAGMRIGEVARRTGTTTALLRAWETRHGVLVPARTAGGQRLYSDRDVARVRLVQQLVSQGWSIAGAVARLRESGDLPAPDGRRTAVDDERPRAVVAHGPTELIAALAAVDPEAVRIAFDCAREMLRSESPAEIRDALVTMVVRLGGTVGPASTQHADVIPVDVSFGEGPPLLPRAEPATLSRMRLDALLPALVEDGRTSAHRLRLAKQRVNQRR